MQNESANFSEYVQKRDNQQNQYLTHEKNNFLKQSDKNSLRMIKDTKKKLNTFTMSRSCDT